VTLVSVSAVTWLRCKKPASVLRNDVWTTQVPQSPKRNGLVQSVYWLLYQLDIQGIAIQFTLGPRDSPSSQTSVLVLGFIQPPFRWVPEKILPRLKHFVREANLSSASSAEFWNERKCIFNNLFLRTFIHMKNIFTLYISSSQTQVVGGGGALGSQEGLMENSIIIKKNKNYFLNSNRIITICLIQVLCI